MHWTPGIPFCVMHYAVPLQGMLEAGGRVVPHVGETILEGDGVAMKWYYCIVCDLQDWFRIYARIHFYTS